MLALFLFLNLFLHVIYFSYFKMDGSVYMLRLTIISILFCIADTIHNIYLLNPEGSGGYSLTLFYKLLRLNNVVYTQEAFLLLITLTLLIAFRDYKFKSEFFLILFANLISATYLLESYNFIILFISWEFFNLTLYTMIVGIGTYKQQALSASLKYFLLSALSTAFLLLALAMIYHITGSLEYESVYLAMFESPIDLPVILIIFALIFKLGAAPLHFWAPDLYSATPMAITAYISNIPKVVYLLLILDLADFLSCQFNFFIIAGFISLIIGTLGLFQQFRIKRFLAFSGIANVGYLLLMVNNPDLLKFNLIIYILAVLNIFIIFLHLESIYEREIENFQQIRGIFHVNPFLALSLTISLFSIAAIPPLPGFFAKYQLLIFAFNEFYTPLFSIIILTSVFAVANYIRLVYIILFNKPALLPSNDFNNLNNNLTNNFVTYIIITLNFALVILFCFTNYLPYAFHM